MRALVLFIAGIVFAATAVKAADWVVVIQLEDKVVSIDTASLRVLGENRKVWVLYDNHQADDEGIKSFKQLQTYQCAERKMRIDSYIMNRDDGSVVSQMPDGFVDDFDDVAPDTVGEAILLYVCENGRKPVS
jgi:hypothetical protein